MLKGLSKWKKNATTRVRIYRKGKKPTSKGKYIVKPVDQPLR